MEVPLLISRQTLSNMPDQLDFTDNTMWLQSNVQISLIATGSSHMQFPAAPTPAKNIQPHVILPPSTRDLGNEMIADEESGRIQLHLGHSIEIARQNLPQSALRQVSDLQIQQLFKTRKYPADAKRLASHEIAPWISKFNGGIVGVDLA